MNNLRIAFFGGEPIGVPVLEELEASGIVPNLIVCSPDKPVGRKQVMTAPPVKEWATQRSIPVFQPTSLKENTGVGPLYKNDWDIFIVVAYNKILPKWLIDIPEHGTLNVHPSLLPQLRGASPIRSAILNDLQETGVSVMLLDEKMDHGPIIAQEPMHIEDAQWPVRGRELDEGLARLGGALLAATLPQWTRGDIAPQEQEHELATYCGKITKADGELTIDPHNLPTGDAARQALLKIYAYDGWPGTFFFVETPKGTKRIKIVDATLDTHGALDIHRVVPEGKKEMDWETFLQTLAA